MTVGARFLLSSSPSPGVVMHTTQHINAHNWLLYSMLSEINIKTMILTHHYCAASFVLCSGTTTQNFTQFTTEHTIQGFGLFVLCFWSV